MYHQAWPWAATATPTATSGFVQPTASTPVATTQWPAGYSQYTVTPEIQQQWAAAWATQAQYAYNPNVPVGGDPQTTAAAAAAAFPGAYPDYQTATTTANETKKPGDVNTAPEKPKTTPEQSLSKDLSEAEKIQQLKEQAEKWTSLQQQPTSWSTAASSVAPSASNTTTVTASNNSSVSLSNTNVTQSNATQNQMSKEEEEFERQFKDWEKQFEAWKQQNQNHPDKEAFAQYEKQWQDWRAQLVQKREQMKKAKAEQMANAVATQPIIATSVAGAVTSQVNSTNITDTTVATSTAAMYYHQTPSYMYMQPYMYGATTAVAPAGAVPPAVVPPAVVPPTVVPPTVMPPTVMPPGLPPAGVPPVSMPPSVMPPTVPPSQMTYNVAPPGHPDYGNQNNLGTPGSQRNEPVNYDNQGRQDFENERDMYNYGPGPGPGPGPMRGNGPRDDGMGPPNYNNYDNANMTEDGFPRDDWNYGRGRGRGGRGRGRGRGRGESRWSDAPPPPEMDMRPGGPQPPRKTLLPGGPPPPQFGGPPAGPSGGPPRGFPGRPGGPLLEEPGDFPEEDEPPPFEYPTEDCKDEFGKDREPFPDDRQPPNRPSGDRFDDGSQQLPPEDFPDQPFDEQYPPEHDQFPPNQRFPPDRKRFPPEQGRFPPGRDRFPPDQERFPPGPEGFQPGRERFPRGHDRFPPDHERFPPGEERFPPNDRFHPKNERFPPDQEGYPPEEEQFPPDEKRFPPGGPERFPPKGGRFPPEGKGFPPEDENFPPGPERYPPEGERYPPGPERFPPEEERFPPGPERFPPEGERFPPGRERFPPPRHMMEEGGFDRDFEQFPPEDEMYGPPPFRDDFPPFDERGGRGRRGRFPGRGRFRGEFDRFGPPFPHRMRGEFPPDFPPPPDDRFGFPGDGPPRMPPPRGMRPQFEPPPFGPDGRFHEEPPPFFDDGPQRFKSIDYTHRPAAAVMGDDFNAPYDYESEFQEDVNAYRDNFNCGVYVAQHREPIILSQVSFESFDYGHGTKPMTSMMSEVKENFKDSESASASKGFDIPFHRDRSPLYRDRNVDFNERDSFRDRERNADFNERDSFRDRERDTFRSRDRDRERDRDRNRDRNKENERERERDRDRERERDRDRRDNSRDNRDRDRDSYDRSRNRERDLKRDRDWDTDHKRDEDDKGRFKWDKNYENDRDKGRSSSKKENDSKVVDLPLQYKPSADIFKNDSSETVLIEDILVEPKRSSRPKQLVIILRGLPGSGKTYFAKLIKDKEIENGGSAPRILSLDDYFMVETEVTETDPDTGKKVKRKEFKFEYEHEMEEVYRSSLFKSFKKTIDDRFFPFIIVDAVNGKSKQYEEYWSYAKQKGFQVYIAEMDCKDPVICHKRNIHNRTLEDITKILHEWERKPRHFISMDVRSLLQDVSITEVEMEVESSDKSAVKNDEDAPDEDDLEESNLFPGHEPSRWEKLEATEEKLDQLDGLRVSKKKHSSMEDYLQLPDDYDERKCEPGKKRVRWADLEQRKEQDRLRAIGFVVGQTDWTKLTDPSQADKALTKTKYF